MDWSIRTARVVAETKPPRMTRATRKNPGGVAYFALQRPRNGLLRGAAIARRRCRLVMQRPLAALWETVGHAGNPPEDDSVLFGTLAVVLTALLWFVLPGLAAAFYFLL